MFNQLQQGVENLIDRGLDRRLRVAVTGLSRSGKTAFITSVINQLLAINTQGGQHLPLFEPARTRRIVGVQRVAQTDLMLPRFDYQANLQDLYQTPPQWCQSTTGIGQIRLALRYQHQHSFLRHLKLHSTLYVEFFDYPGEWLLDLPLLNWNFQQWSQQYQQQQQFSSARQISEFNCWQQKVAKLDLFSTADENVLAQLAKEYTQILHQYKTLGLQLIQPGRFVLPGELENAPVLQFFPLLALSPQQWQQLNKTASANSYFMVLKKRYNHYCETVVKPFYQNYFIHFDRQIILADCLTPLNHSRVAFEELRLGLQQLFHSFKYGKRSLFNRLFAPKIDKLLFAATKADHITTDQIPNLISLLRQLIQQDGEHLTFQHIQLDYTALASIRATQQVIVQAKNDTTQYKALQGRRLSDQQQITVFPGTVPANLPPATFWQKNRFAFDPFQPPILDEGKVLPHLRLDAVLQFLLADKLE
ncbi:hypothetical protein CEP48_02055 [Mergibacter septicus]|uniref:Uncharacterized protein n=1 Tax=Mergibacter septicus TaxID=221402 RepID=A0A8E3SBJ8_9PAST|nr:YcjX family protein [Mergibacter septicus]AWX15018.1 hypothetical protein CEP47_02055 [Mergibacter septicus]QDJ14270.1 hypothetical protein CEP48_02055 [Mergibacter septicus]UTU48286.1 YcjX family protein [Mergibacter septicus]WMR96093.1 YcjX family protein [Mergibacter septicus]